MAALDIATLGLRLDAQGFIRDAKAAENALGGIEKKSVSLGSTIRTMAAALGGAWITREVIRNTIEAQNSMAQLEAAIRSTGGAAGRTVAQINELATAMQHGSTFSVGNIREAATALTAFGRVAGDVFDRTIKLSTDMATRMGGDVRGAVMQLGKALDDPVRGMMLLRRAGVTFSEGQERVIKSLWETGKQVEAQNALLDEIEKKYGGAAKAARDTLGGALTALKNEWHHALVMSSDASSGIVDAINKIADFIPKARKVVDEFLGGFELMMIDAAYYWNMFVLRVQQGEEKLLRVLAPTARAMGHWEAADLMIRQADQLKSRFTGAAEALALWRKEETERVAGIQSESIPVGRQQIAVLDEIVVSAKDAQEAAKKAAEEAAKAEEKRRQALEQTLTTAEKALWYDDELSTVIPKLAAAYLELNAELENGNTTWERHVELLAQTAQAQDALTAAVQRTAAIPSLPPAALTGSSIGTMGTINRLNPGWWKNGMINRPNAAPSGGSDWMGALTSFLSPLTGGSSLLTNLVAGKNVLSDLAGTVGNFVSSIFNHSKAAKEAARIARIAAAEEAQAARERENAYRYSLRGAFGQEFTNQFESELRGLIRSMTSVFGEMLGPGDMPLAEMDLGAIQEYLDVLRAMPYDELLPAQRELLKLWDLYTNALKESADATAAAAKAAEEEAAAKAAADAKALAATKEDWQVKLAYAQATDEASTKEAARLDRQIQMQRDLDGVTDEALQTLIKQYYAQLDLNDANSEAAAAAEEAAAEQERQAAAARALAEATEDWTVRLLRAQGDTAGADAMQREIDMRRALEGVTDENLRALIELVFQTEAAAAAAQAAADAQAEATRAQEEAARAAQEAAKAALANARAYEDLEVRRLAATGGDAELLQLQLKQQREIEDAIASGMSDAFVAKLREVLDLEMKAFQAARVSAAVEDVATAKDAESEVIKSVRGVSETTAIRMVDLQMSSNIWLREIAVNTRGLRGTDGAAYPNLVGGRASVVINGNITAADPATAGKQIGTAAINQISIGLANMSQATARNSGDATV